MSITPIDIVIDPPLPTDAPSIFDQKAFAAWADINGWATQANALAEQVNEDADRVNDPSVQAVADNISAIVAVDANKTNIDAVAGNATNINAVHANKANIDTVAGKAADVTTVATNITAVNTAATNMAAITAAPGAASAAESFKDTAEAAAAAAQAAAGLPAIAGKAGAGLKVNEDETGVEWGLTKAAPTLDGPTVVDQNDTVTYTITNYSAFSSYSVSVTAGTASISGNTITFNAPASEQVVTLMVTVHGVAESFSIEVLSPYIATPAATPSNFGDAFEGGFYAGMIWNELIQSNTETTIGTGEKTFDCPTLTRAVTYIGHEVEIRSRANPANNMVATVTASSLSDKTITVNVTSVNGSGTFSDWSIMSRYRVIVAPKASGENASVRIKNTNTTLPAGCQSLTDGWGATNAMFNADTSTVYPAAHWARGLSIGGFDDWYVPARDELELSWRNLKPVTNNNSTGARQLSAIDYGTNGNYGDQPGDAQGLNRNSAPAGAAYTTTVPAQTGVALFQQGGAEAYEFGSAYYWSCTEYSEIDAWNEYWTSVNPGFQINNNKLLNRRLRAVRRSII